MGIEQIVFQGRERSYPLDRGDGTTHVRWVVRSVKLLKTETCNNQSHSNIFNLSKTFHLSQGERLLLEKGLTFIPTPGGADLGDLKKDVHLRSPVKSSSIEPRMPLLGNCRSRRWTHEGSQDPSNTMPNEIEGTQTDFV